MIMEIGSKIKQLRLQLNLSQTELADRCELTKGYISQLENDLTSPSISTLCDILAALGTDLSEFFKKEDDSRIVFTENDFVEKRENGMLWKWIIPNAQKNEMEPVLVELESGASTTVDFPHEGEEFGYVLDGKISIELDKKKYSCKKGEAFYYSADKPHTIYNSGKTNARFIWISTPPNF
jgi:transcriptional regulator with XRE-family HTH domain